MKKAMESKSKFTAEQIEWILEKLYDTDHLDETPMWTKKIDTKIICPMCKEKNLIMKLRGNSYRMDCPIDGLAYSMRGL